MFNFFGLVDTICDVMLGPTKQLVYPKAKPGPTPPPARIASKTVVCPFCRTNVILYENEKRLNIHGPGPMGQTVCPGSGPNPRWKLMQ